MTGFPNGNPRNREGTPIRNAGGLEWEGGGECPEEDRGRGGGGFRTSGEPKRQKNQGGSTGQSE